MKKLLSSVALGMALTVPSVALAGCGAPPVPIPPAGRCHVSAGVERVNFGLQGQAIVDCVGRWAGLGLSATVTLQSAQSWVQIGGWQIPGHWKQVATTKPQVLLTSHTVLHSAYVACKPNHLGNHLYRVGVTINGLMVRNGHTYYKESHGYYNCG